MNNLIINEHWEYRPAPDSKTMILYCVRCQNSLAWCEHGSAVYSISSEKEFKELIGEQAFKKITFIFSGKFEIKYEGK